MSSMEQLFRDISLVYTMISGFKATLRTQACHPNSRTNINKDIATAQEELSTLKLKLKTDSQLPFAQRTYLNDDIAVIQVMITAFKEKLKTAPNLCISYSRSHILNNITGIQKMIKSFNEQLKNQEMIASFKQKLKNRNINNTMMASDLEKFLLDELTCPSCYNYMCPPINQCQKGHNVCNECFPRVNICPKCRAPKSNTSRNYALEAIHGRLRIPCKYQYLGCDYVCLGETIKNHQKYCKFTKQECPFSSYDNCQWKDSIIKLKIHLLKKHSHNFYQKDKQKFISQHFRNIINYHYIFAVIYVFDNYFRLTWDINEGTGMTRWAVYFMGSPEDAKKYSYKLEFTKGYQIASNTVPLTFKSVCDPKSDTGSSKFSDHNCFYIHKTLLDKYCIDNGDLHYRVSIYSLQEEEEYTSDIALLFVEGAKNYA